MHVFIVLTEKKKTVKLLIVSGLWAALLWAQSVDVPVYRETERLQGMVGGEIRKYFYLALLYFPEV